MDPPISLPAVAGQVCDRCRLKKVKCDGAVPSCSGCLTAGTSCTVTAKLRRKTKIRGFQISAEEQIKRLQAENDELRRSLRVERETNAALQRRLEDASNASVGTPNYRHEPPQKASGGRPPQIHTESQEPRGQSALIFRHMGRLVSDSAGEERFAGSTSGVHFVLSVQQTVQNRRIRLQPFPESCFRLHLLEPYGNSTDLFDMMDSEANLLRSVMENSAHYFPMPESFYTEQISLFDETWAAFCPVVAPLDLSRSISDLLRLNIREARSQPGDALLVIFQVCLVVVFNSMRSKQITEDNSTSTYLSFIHMMIPRLIVKGNLASLQALILYSFYLQSTGQVLLMTQMNGVLVRLAQSAGLHRHARRFKFVEGQIEMRKRMWWWIYLYDKLVSVTQGLPKLINDVDVDVDYPLDCELREVNTTQLAFPLPGEVTQVSEFISYVHLGRILSETLSELYTTTKRRQGVEKIAKLHTDLQAWEQRAGNHLTNPEPSYTDTQSVMRLWMTVVAHITLILIHRPALTFDENTPQFVKSLEICSEASSVIISLLNSHEGRTTLYGLSPIGPSLIFQCGLMRVLYSCHHRGSPDVGRGMAHGLTDELVALAADMLSNYVPVMRTTPYKQQALHKSLATSLKEASDLLRSIHFSLGGTTVSASTSPGQELPGFATPSQTITPNNQASSLDFLGQFEMLDPLNHLDWILDGSPVGATPAFESNV